MNVQLVVERIDCIRTTEEGHDELYLLLGGATYDANSAPTPISGRAPNRAQGADADPNGPNQEFTAWDCNDSGQMQHKYLNAYVFTTDVPENGHVVLSVNVMESDGTKLGDQLAGGANFAAEILRVIPSFGDAAAGLVKGLAEGLKALIPRNEDDHLGALSFAFANKGGKVFVTDAVYGSGASHIAESRVGVAPYKNAVRFDGDGSGYVVVFRIDGAEKGRRVATGPAAQGDDMQPGEVLNPGDSIRSADGRYCFTYQWDGNLVLYRTADSRALWASNTAGTYPGVCIMQGDGNLVVYDEDSHPRWDSGTWDDAGSHLIVQNDGNVVIYAPNGTPVWATNTGVREEPGECSTIRAQISACRQQMTALLDERGGLNVRNPVDRQRINEINREMQQLRSQLRNLEARSTVLVCNV